MRSCIYCGRELEKGEVCNCPGAAARRSANSTNNTNNTAHSDTNGQTQNNQSSHNSYNNTYHTGYTARENPVKRAWERRRTRATARRNSGEHKHFWSGLWGFIKRFVISPVDTISNPGYISKGTALTLAMISGAIINLCLYFLRTGAVRTPFGIVLSLITANPMQSYSNLFYIVTSLISGAIAGILLFFIFAGIFYFISKLVFRQSIRFWDFAPRFSLTPMPLVMLSIIGILIGTLSSTSLAIMIICGLVGMVILTYEALRTILVSYPSGKVMYATVLGYLIFAAIICYIIRLS